MLQGSLSPAQQERHDAAHIYGVSVGSEMAFQTEGVPEDMGGETVHVNLVISCSQPYIHETVTAPVRLNATGLLLKLRLYRMGPGGIDLPPPAVCA